MTIRNSRSFHTFHRMRTTHASSTGRSKAFTGGVLCAAALALLLTGCKQKPPGCVAPETVKTVRGIFVESAQKALRDELRSPVSRPWTEKYLASLQLTITEAVSSGYDKEMQLQSCEGKITVSTPTGQQFSNRFSYFTQITADGESFLASIHKLVDDPDALYRSSLYKDAVRYIEAQALTGDWHGIYACQGMGGDTSSEPKGPFSQPVTLVVDGSHMLLQRATRGGGFENAEGRVTMEGSVELEGVGRNTPEDAWRVHYKGRTDGKTLKLKGGLYDGTGMPMRLCSIEASRVSESAGSAASSSP